MHKSSPFILALILLAFSYRALKIKDHYSIKFEVQKQNHYEKLKNFSFALINADFNGASGMYFNDRLVSIQFKFIDKDSGQEKKSQKYGPDWGISFDWSVSKGQTIKTVEFWRDDFMVNGLQFETDNGQKSPLFGVKQGTYESQKLNEKKIVGLEGVYCGGGVRVLELILS